MMDFQGLASKMKAAAAKINFDQMAANDDYIHSDDLNVKGRNNTNRRKSNETTETTEPTITTQRPVETVMRAASANQSSVKPTVDSHQQQQQQREWLSFSATSNRTPTEDLKTHSTHVPLADRRSQNAPIVRQSTMPLLSVVANTLAQAQQQQQQQQQQAQTKVPPAASNVKVEAPSFKKPNAILKSDSDSEDDDDDGDDEILNLLRDKNSKVPVPKANQSLTMTKTTDVRAAVSSNAAIRQPVKEIPDMNLGLQQKKKNPHRFMDDFDQTELSDHSSSSQHQEKKKNPKRFLEDLDQRLSKPLDIEAGSTASTTTSTTADYDGDTEYYDNSTSNNQWSWIRNAVASSRINTMLGQPLPFFKETTTTAPPARKGPLSRREVVPLVRNDGDDDDDVPVVMVHSSSVLGAAEQAELARLAHRSSALRDFLGVAMDMFKQNPTHSLFLVFTLLLALAVYFYSRNRTIGSSGLG